MARKSEYQKFLEMTAESPRAQYYRDAQWLKLSNQALRALGGSPKQKEIKKKMEARERELDREGGKSNPRIPSAYTTTADAMEFHRAAQTQARKHPERSADDGLKHWLGALPTARRTAAQAQLAITPANRHRFNRTIDAWRAGWALGSGKRNPDDSQWPDLPPGASTTGYSALLDRITHMARESAGRAVEQSAETGIAPVPAHSVPQEVRGTKYEAAILDGPVKQTLEYEIPRLLRVSTTRGFSKKDAEREAASMGRTGWKRLELVKHPIIKNYYHVAGTRLLKNFEKPPAGYTVLGRGEETYKSSGRKSNPSDKYAALDAAATAQRAKAMELGRDGKRAEAEAAYALFEKMSDKAAKEYLRARKTGQRTINPKLPTASDLDDCGRRTLQMAVSRGGMKEADILRTAMAVAKLDSTFPKIRCAQVAEAAQYVSGVNDPHSKQNYGRIEKTVEGFLTLLKEHGDKATGRYAGSDKSVGDRAYGVLSMLTQGEMHNPHGRKRNSANAAADLYATFHGVPSTESIEVSTPILHHANLAALGTLVEIKFNPAYGKLNNKIITLSFANDGVTLASNESATQLYFVGGNQSVPLADLVLNAPQYLKDAMLLGTCYELTYNTRKKFDKLKSIDYYHAVGEVTKECPVLTYNPVTKQLALAGGAYEIKDVGICN